MFHSWQSRNLSDKIVKYASVVFFNVIMWLCHVESLESSLVSPSYSRKLCGKSPIFRSCRILLVWGSFICQGSEGDHPDFLKSFIIGSDLFNILVGLKPRSFSSEFSYQAELVRRSEEHTQATPDRPIDEKQLYYDATGECSKGRVYRLGSLAKRRRRYEDPGASTSREPMMRRSELDAVVQRLAQFEAFLQSQLGMRMDFGASTFQAPPPPPPPPPPHEHQ
ncbi:hypothetical protein Scep_028310 [Stephania cephalantha]|uniref:Uncharacterized protein n=1 Tax=Stephania cephalantha TaxID=152367 RepID=A0AAP0EH32_9MAGN